MLRVCVAAAFLSLLTACSLFGAKTFKVTVYNDGKSCPNGCDPHVVFVDDHNGTRYASLPSSSRSKPVACVSGEPCRICFDKSDASCIEAVYRGRGPSKNRFDFTTSFYEATCGKPGLPQQIAEQCESMQKTYDSITVTKIYCPADPANPVCKDVIAKAEAAKTADKVFYDECRADRKAFNKKYSAAPAMQRSEDCAYEFLSRGGNSKNPWHLLLPAACWPGSYVDKSGLDCCDQTKMSLGAFGRECSAYLAPKD